MSFDLKIGIILDEIGTLIKNANQDVITKLLSGTMDADAEAYLDTVYQYVDTIIIKALRSKSDSKDIFVEASKSLLNTVECVQGKLRKCFCVRIIFYVAYYHILDSVKNNCSTSLYVETVNNKLIEFINSNEIKDIFNANEAESYGNFLTTMIDVHAQIKK